MIETSLPIRNTVYFVTLLDESRTRREQDSTRAGLDESRTRRESRLDKGKLDRTTDDRKNLLDVFPYISFTFQYMRTR
jgi:hypothetical protein